MTLHHIKNRTKKPPPLRVGIGGPVGSGKTTLLEMLCKAMRDRYDLVAITNDIYTKEDQRLLTVSGALPAERIMGVETGGCPHTAIREDAYINLEAIDRMLVDFPDADIVINKTDLAPMSADLAVMQADTTRMRTTTKGLKPFVLTNLKTLSGLAEVVAFIETKGMLLPAAEK